MRPLLHYTPRKNWCNDPNGLIYFNNEYHMYYQYFPYGKEWGTMHWGHATSKDLVHFKERDIALFPSIKEDMNGVFSGSAIVKNNKINIFYTGVKYKSFNDKNIHIPKYKDDFLASQIKIISNDGYFFDNFNDKKVILRVSEDASISHPIHTRDPKVWEQEDKFYMILGTKTSDEQSGKINIYESEDLQNFKLFCSYTKTEYGNMWECPDYFIIDKSQLLIMSPENFVKTSLYPSQPTIQKADFNIKSKSFCFEDSYEFLDYGFDCYAPQTFIDEYGKRTLISWIRMPEYFAKDNDYIGSYTFPRNIEILNNEIYYKLHPNIQKGFVRCNDFSKDKVSKINIKMQKDDYFNIGGYIISYDNKVIVDRTNCFSLTKGVLLSTPHINKNSVDLEIIIDKNIIEVFIDNGRYVITNYIDSISNDINTNIVNDIQIFEFEKKII